MNQSLIIMNRLKDGQGLPVVGWKSLITLSRQSAICITSDENKSFCDIDKREVLAVEADQEIRFTFNKNKTRLDI